jgi:hypothetical protein
MAGRRRSDRALRAKSPSPGRPGVARREDRRRFWALIAAGQSSWDAAIGVGVSEAVGSRWFREAGGMPPSTLGRSSKPPSGRSLSFAEREEIAVLRAQGCGVREVARRLGRAASTVSRGRTHCVRPAQCGHAQRRAGVPGHDGAVACRAGGAASEAGEAGDAPGAEGVCARPAGGCRGGSGRGCGARSGGAVEGPAAWAAAASALGESMEPTADLAAAAARLSWR